MSNSNLPKTAIIDPIVQKIEEIKSIENNAKAQAMINLPVEKTEPTMLDTILKALKTYEQGEIQRVSFDVDPQKASIAQAGFYRIKIGLTPDNILKKVTGPSGDELVNQIIQARSNHMASFGRPRTSRFTLGFEFQPIKGLNSDNNKADDKDSLNALKEVFWHCGHKGMSEDFHFNFSQFLKMITRDALTFGRVAVERIFVIDPETQEEKFHSFRAVDAGTIMRLSPFHKKDKQIRQQALALLRQLKGEKVIPEDYDKDEYKWAQVIDGRTVQVFTEKELIVYNFYPTTNVDFNGYPLTPIDQALNAVSTHINITLHNKLYFQQGRAAKGLMIFKSDSIDEPTIQKIRSQYQQSINSVNNAWRTPIFAIGPEDDLIWTATDVQGKDAEFQYLSDQNARVILGAFQMSPDELPGYSHLSKGTNTQSLSESNNEYKLTAHRSVGLRPLVYDMQDLLNTHIFPFINKEMSKKYQIILAGLESLDPEKEATRLLQDSQVHLTYNNILEIVEKETVAKEIGGDLPLSQNFWQTVSPFLTVGQIMESFMGIKDAALDPRYAYIRDPFWMQQQQMLLQKAQLKMQQDMQQVQMMQQQLMAAQNPEGLASPEEEQPKEGEESKPTESVAQKYEKVNAVNYQLLEKSINSNGKELNKILLDNHRKQVRHYLESWKDKSKQAIDKIIQDVDIKEKK